MSLLAASLAIYIAASAPQSGAAAEPQNSAGAMFARISQLEEQNRRLRGDLEEIEYKLDKAESENRVLKSDLKKSQEEAATAKASVQKPKVVIEPASADEGPKIAPKPVITEAAPNDEFDKSFGYMSDGDTEQAKKSFTDFIKKYPSSSLSGEAYYWLGEIAFDAQDYNNAAINYLKGYREYPKGTKAPENILKLALTLKELGKTDEACQNLARFHTEFKTAHANLLAKAASYRQQLKCQ